MRATRKSFKQNPMLGMPKYFAYERLARGTLSPKLKERNINVRSRGKSKIHVPGTCDVCIFSLLTGWSRLVPLVVVDEIYLIWDGSQFET